MTRVLIQRGSAGSSSSSNQNRSSSSAPVPNASSSSASTQQQVARSQDIPAITGEDLVDKELEHIVVQESSEHSAVSESPSEGRNSEDLSPISLNTDHSAGETILEDEKVGNDNILDSVNVQKGFGGLTHGGEEADAMVGSSFKIGTSSSHPPPPPLPPPKPFSVSSNSRRYASGESNAVQFGPCRRPASWPVVPHRSSPTGSRPSSPQCHSEGSPRCHSEGEGYNSADEQSPCFTSSYNDAEREQQFEIDLRRVRGLEVRKMRDDGNCLFRAVADQVYGDSELYDLVRQMCIDYMERERDHFSQFVTEGFTSYCKRKRRDKVYGNNMEIQALSEMYNRPIHIYSYSTEPINIFHGSYNTDTPPIRLSYHHGNHYNSLVDPRRLSIGAGLGFSSLRGTNVGKDQVKAAIKAQQDQQIDNALLAEGRFYSDLELTEKEMERMVMEASRAEYLADDKFKQQLGHRESSTSGAEPSSSAARSPGKEEGGLVEFGSSNSVLSESMQIMLSMGFSYLQVMEAYSIFGDDVDSMVSYLIETSSGGRRKGKATE